jgi:serine/threonine protein kinase
MSDPSYADALPAQYQLHWYVLERVLGQGGFGITYLARDTNLDQPVAIKEYLPVDVATRRPDASVRSRTEDQTERYRWGLDRFIREARTLARFDHPNIVRVHSVFEINNTAYMVMRFEEGENLASLLEHRRTLPEEELLRVVLPILDGLALVHDAGFIHRDIKPDNIHIRDDGAPVLLDFGSARLAHGHRRTVTILVAPGYAPFEQYHSSGEKQGPWTDIYSLGATCYRALTGIEPMDAISRSRGVLYSTGDPMVPAATIGATRYSAGFLKAVDHALSFAEQDRPQSISAWRQELAAKGAARKSWSGTRRGVAPARAAAPGDGPVPARWKRLLGPISWTALGAAIAALIVVIWPPQSEPPAPKPSPIVEPPPTQPVKPGVIGGEHDLDTAERRRLQEDRQARAAERARRDELEQKVAALELRIKQEADARRKAETERLRDLERARLEAEKRRQAEAEARRQEAARKAELARAAEQQRAEDARKAEEARRAAQASAAAATKSAPKPDPGAKLLAAAGEARARGDVAEYLEILRKAASQGNAQAQFSLGEAYAAGRGVGRSDFQAYVWFSLAAQGGFAGAAGRRDATATSLQPAERQQADHLVRELRREAAAR